MTGRYYADGQRLAPVVCPGCHERLDLKLANNGERTHPTCGPEAKALQK